MARDTNVDKERRAEALLEQHGDVSGQWRISASQMDLSKNPRADIEIKRTVEGRLSEALLKAAYLLTEYKHIEIADYHGGTTIHMRG